MQNLTLSAQDVERYNQHGREYPVWMDCPVCTQERNDAARAEHFTARMKEGENLLRLVDFEEEPEPDMQGSAIFWTLYAVGLALVGWCVGYWRNWWHFPF